MRSNDGANIFGYHSNLWYIRWNYGRKEEK
jgi:hypothetical protein